MVEWWLMEPLVRDKFYEDICVRLKDADAPYTQLFQLPRARLRTYADTRIEHWGQYEIGAIEINGTFI